MVKTAAEIEHIHYICQIASDAYEALPAQISIGESEREVVAQAPDRHRPSRRRRDALHAGHLRPRRRAADRLRPA